ncbi:MAG: acylphosphatase, partial [Armatimonadetes bacterium]|nr:acylphosphatase [Armatimonadota bacterium]
ADVRLSAHKSETQPKRRLRAVISGRGQGVSFRFFAQRGGNSLRLSGWVRNRGHDEVEGLAEGPPEALQRLLEELRRGPSAAYVSKVYTEWSDPRGDLPMPFAVAPSVWVPSGD